MENVVTKFLDSTVEKKREQLLGILLDRGYWKNVLASLGDEEKLRNELAEENAKRVISKMGNVIEDKRDMVKVAELNKRLDDIADAQKEMKQLDEIEPSIRAYIKHIQNPDKETMTALEEVSKL